MPRRLPALLAAFALLVAAISAPAAAHTPVLQAIQARPGETLAPDRAVEIPDLDESTAFYGWISRPGFAGVYTFEVSSPLRLNASLLVPILAGDAFRGYRPELLLVGPGIRGAYNGLPFELPLGSGVAVRRGRFEPVFHEPFSHTDYRQGPEFRRELSPGRYYLLVYSAADNGPYCLVTGTKERLFKVIFRTVENREKLTRIFFAVGATPLRSPYGLSAYHWMLMSALAFMLLAWLTARKADPPGWRVAVVLLNGVALLALALALLEIRISVLPGWIFWSASGAAAANIAGMILRSSWLRGLAGGVLAVVLAVCIA